MRSFIKAEVVDVLVLAKKMTAQCFGTGIATFCFSSSVAFSFFRQFVRKYKRCKVDIVRVGRVCGSLMSVPNGVVTWELGGICFSPILGRRKIVEEFSFCRNIIIPKCQIWAEKAPFWGNLGAKLKFRAAVIYSVKDFLAVCRNSAPSPLLQISNPRWCCA